jgi:hypothetical protein
MHGVPNLARAYCTLTVGLDFEIRLFNFFPRRTIFTAPAAHFRADSQTITGQEFTSPTAFFA